MTEQEFKRYFCFSKRTVTLIAEAFDQELRATDKRDMLLEPVIKVCIALGVYGGGHC